MYIFFTKILEMTENVSLKLKSLYGYQVLKERKRNKFYLEKSNTGYQL